ncbi:MAG: winged helix-turn-helix transcriptional regulator [Sedimentisphaerales bacterium]|nr:winged helix-turn-helix transcriptional regulator [Sedimentisphaerales bacterium]
MDRIKAKCVAEVLKAMGHPVRLQIVALIGREEKCVSEIVATLKTKHSITSQQLNMMKDKGLLDCRRDGNRVFYRVANPNVLSLLDCISSKCQN